MRILWNSFISTAVIGLLLLCGYFSGAWGWMGKESKAFLSKFLLSVAVPFMCIYSLKTNISREMLFSLGHAMLVLFAVTMAVFLLALSVAHLVRMPHRRMGVFMPICALSNAVLVGHAMCLELFGEASVPYSMGAYFVSIALMQTIGNGCISWSGGAGGFSAAAAVKSFFQSPPVLGVLAAVLFVLLDLPVPALLLSFGQYMGNIVPPLAMMISGYVIYEIGLKNLHIDRDMVLVILFRFLICPAVTVLGCVLFGVEGLMRSVLLVQAAMPAPSVTVIAATEYGADEQFAARAIAVTTLGSFLIIPLLMAVI